MGALVQSPQISSPEDPYRDCAVTLNRIIEDHRSALGLKRCYDHDPWIVPVYPATAIEFVDAPENIVSLSRAKLGPTYQTAYDFNMIFHIWYYHETISKKIHDADMQTKLASLNGVFKEHPTINCYAGPGWAEVRRVAPAARERERETLLGGFLEIMVPRRICYTHNPNCVP